LADYLPTVVHRTARYFTPLEPIGQVLISDFTGLESYFELLARLPDGSTPPYQGVENAPG
jgi:hypothetical protein